MTTARGHMRGARAFLAAVVVAVTVLLLRRAGVLYGVPALALGLLLALSVPWSTCLSRRLLLAGAIFLGWMPLLWWVRLPVGNVGRVGLTLALASGALAGWVCAAPNIRIRARRLVPRMASVDTIPVAAALVALWATWPLITSPSGDRTLNLVMKLGYDHVTHLFLVMLIRSKGAIVPMLGPSPDGTPWHAALYPQHLHATLTALTELFSGASVGDAATEVLEYGRSLALLQVLIAGLLAAGVAQLPRLRRRPSVAWPVAAVVVGAFVFGPGSAALASGYPNFVLACATVGLAALLATSMSRELGPLRIFALGGLVVATAHGWALLAPLALVATSVAFVPLRRARWPRTRTKAVAIWAALSATVGASVAVVPLLGSSGASAGLAVFANPPEYSMSHLVTWLLLFGGAAIAATLAASARAQDLETALRGVALTAIPGSGLLLLISLAAYQLATAGELSYYVGKVATGITLISVVVLATGIAVGIRPALPRQSVARRSAAAAASIVATVAVFQLFGYVGPLLPKGPLFAGLDVAPGVQYRADARVLTSGPSSEASRLLQAAAIAESRPFASTVYVAAMTGDADPFRADLWKRALSLNWSSQLDEADAEPLASLPGYKDVSQAADVTRALLSQSSLRAVVVAPELAAEIRKRLPPDLRSRVITW